MKLRLTFLAICAMLSVIGMTASVNAHEHNESDTVDGQVQTKNYRTGMWLVPVSDELRSHLKLPEGKIPIIAEMLDNSPASSAGLKVHDIVVKVNGSEWESLESFGRAVNEAGNDDKKLSIEVIRAGEKRTFEVKPVERSLLAIGQTRPGFVMTGPSIGFAVADIAPDGVMEVHKMLSEGMKAELAKRLDAMNSIDEEYKSLSASLQKLAREMRATSLTKQEVEHVKRNIELALKIANEMRAKSTTKQDLATASVRKVKAVGNKDLESKVRVLDEKMDKIIELLNARSKE